MSRKRTVGDPGGGPLPSQGLGHGMAEPLRLRGSAMADPHGRAPLSGARGSARRRWFAFLSVFPWFLGLFSKHRSRMNVILEPLRSYLRYGHNGSCFVGFRGRLTLQTPRNVERYRKNGLSGTQQGVP